MRRDRLPTLALVLLTLALVFSLPGCRTTVPNRDPLGEPFPAVSGEGLDGTVRALPADLDGAPAVLLVGYVQDAQFDLDRWLLGLLQAGTPGRVLEVPTVAGLVPGLIAGTIDGGMRSGIPSEDWASVVTLYRADAKRVVALTGNERPRNGRILLLDEEGRVDWFHDRGYSAAKLVELDARVRALLATESNPGE